MKRRSFLKFVGLTVVSPCLPLVRAEETALFNKEVCAKVREQLTPQPIKPVLIDGKNYYICVMNPKQEYDLRVMCARDKYKQEQWSKRYDKWRLSQGKLPHQNEPGECFEL